MGLDSIMHNTKVLAQEKQSFFLNHYDRDVPDFFLYFLLTVG